MISIIICTRNRSHHLKKTLRSLEKVRCPEGKRVEVLIVDNGSTDDTSKIVEHIPFPNFEKIFISEPKKGKSYAFNRGLAEAQGDVLLFTDDDVRFPENWISGMAEPILNGTADAVAGGVRIATHLEHTWMESWHRAYLASSERIESATPDDMVGANMAIARHVLDTVPHSDTELGPGALGACQESHFADRIHHAGFKIAPAFDIEVEHHFDPSRLKRSAWKVAARKLGRSQAYIHHHWRHEQQTFPGGRLGPYLELVSLYARMTLKRLLNMKDVLQEEGMASWESYYLRQIAYIKQGIQERRRPRLYEKYGSRKKPVDR